MVLVYKFLIFVLMKKVHCPLFMNTWFIGCAHLALSHCWIVQLPWAVACLPNGLLAVGTKLTLPARKADTTTKNKVLQVHPTMPPIATQLCDHLLSCILALLIVHHLACLHAVLMAEQLVYRYVFHQHTRQLLAT